MLYSPDRFKIPIIYINQWLHSHKSPISTEILLIYTDINEQSEVYGCFLPYICNG